MSQTVHNPEAMSDAELLAAAVSDVCAVCGRPKLTSRAFCNTDWAALPLHARWDLGRGLNSPGFVGIMRCWLRHLLVHKDRSRLFRSRAGELTFRTLDELLAAGYKFKDRVQCAAPSCLQPILLVRRPDRSLLALDEPQLQPHRFTCKDPEYLQRRRELKERVKTSARRRRAR
jgi:hypothetical protein